MVLVLDPDVNSTSSSASKTPVNHVAIESALTANAIRGEVPSPPPGGHEGSGVVEEVGPDVKTLKPGDHVAISFLPACGSCRWCATGYTYLCDVGANLYSKETTTDGTRRRHLGDEDLMAMMQVGTFSEYVVASERSLVKVHDWIPLAAASLVSCGVTAGFGSGSVAAGTEPGDTVVVVGVGGIGMNAVQGAKIAGAKQIVAVDQNAFKREVAPSLARRTPPLTRARRRNSSRRSPGASWPTASC